MPITLSLTTNDNGFFFSYIDPTHLLTPLLHLTHLHLKQIFYVFATTVKPPRSNKFCHATSTVDIAWFDEFCNRHPEIISHPSVLTHQGAFDTCSRHNQSLLTLPSSAQNTGEAHGSPVITPTTAPSSNLPPNLKTRPGILSYSASRRHSTRPIRYRPRHRLLHTSGLAQQYLLTSNPVEHPGVTPNFKNLTTNPIEHPGVTPNFQKNLTTNPVEHPGITPNFKNLTTNPVEHPGVTPNFQKNLTTNPVEHPGITPNFKNLTTNPVEHPGVTPNFQKNLTTNPVEHPGITPNFKNLTTNPVEHSIHRRTFLRTSGFTSTPPAHSGKRPNPIRSPNMHTILPQAKETQNFEIQTILDFHLDAEYTPSCDNALSHSGDLLDMIEGVSSTCPVSKNDAHRDTAGNEDPASTKSS
ncbi:Transforming acidic coiled-coil-containing protein 3 [Folsomia candida]|uniref:Transforming acidic coiled-coil-containing protein 3 n=1 Tax=Folsomia candida TaxID=158441 RepID=A0A226DMR8_FOLCA|nr:Transforming acidic coiled-coil-containing protein 3 [Folsomia candida]